MSAFFDESASGRLSRLAPCLFGLAFTFGAVFAKDLPEWFTSNISSEKIKEYRLEASLKRQSLNSSYLQEWRTLRNCIQNYDSNRNFDDEYVSDIHSINSQPQCNNQLSNNSNEPHKQGNKKLRGH